MNQEDVFDFVVKVLEEMKINYAIGGSVASTVYGKPRLTYDMDVLIDIRENQIGDFISHFNNDWYVDAEMFKEAISKQMPFNIIHIPTANKVDFFPVKDEEYEKKQLLNKKEQKLNEERTAFFVSPEDVIIKKLDYYVEGKSEKHLVDIKGILETYQGKLDFQYIERWTKKKNSYKIWEKIKSE